MNLGFMIFKNKVNLSGFTRPLSSLETPNGRPLLLTPVSKMLSAWETSASPDN